MGVIMVSLLAAIAVIRHRHQKLKNKPFDFEAELAVVDLAVTRISHLGPLENARSGLAPN